MLSPNEFLSAKSIIREQPRRNELLDVFTEIIPHIQPNTGKVSVTRETIAATTGIDKANVSRAMMALVKLGILERKGTRQRPEYYIRATIAWRGAEDRRQDAAQRMAGRPKHLRLVADDGQVVP